MATRVGQYTYGHCTICGARRKLDSLTDVRYEGPDDLSTGGGRVCSDCLTALPFLIAVGSETWMLVLRAP